MRYPDVAKMLSILTLTLVGLPARAEPIQALVTITFDDSYQTQYLNAFPILKRYGLTATEYVITREIGGDTDDPIWRPMTWDNLKQLRDAGWEIGSHTLTHPHLPTLDDRQLRDEVVFSGKHIERQLGKMPTSFAAPYGEVDGRVLAVIRTTYQSNSTTGDTDGGGNGINDLAKVDPYNIARLVVKRDMLPDEVCEAVDNAVAERKWIVLAFHQIVEQPRQTPDGDYMVSNSDLDQISKCIADDIKAGKLKDLNITDALTLTKSNQSAEKAN